MKTNKKGAIEMSMTTIIIIIIGVVLLSLGLVFVQQIFKKATRLTEDTFAKAEGSIANFGEINKPLSLSADRIEVEKGSDYLISVILANFEERDTIASAKITVPTQFKNDINCVFVDTESATSDPLSIPSGEFRSVNLRIESKNEGSLGSKSCKITATGLGESIQDTVSIKIVS